MSELALDVLPVGRPSPPPAPPSYSDPDAGSDSFGECLCRAQSPATAPHDSDGSDSRDGASAGPTLPAERETRHEAASDASAAERSKNDAQETDATATDAPTSDAETADETTDDAPTGIAELSNAPKGNAPKGNASKGQAVPDAAVDGEPDDERTDEIQASESVAAAAVAAVATVAEDAGADDLSTPDSPLEVAPAANGANAEGEPAARPATPLWDGLPDGPRPDRPQAIEKPVPDEKPAPATEIDARAPQLPAKIAAKTGVAQEPLAAPDAEPFPPRSPTVAGGVPAAARQSVAPAESNKAKSAGKSANRPMDGVPPSATAARAAPETVAPAAAEVAVRADGGLTSSQQELPDFSRGKGDSDPQSAVAPSQGPPALESTGSDRPTNPSATESQVGALEAPRGQTRSAGVPATGHSPHPGERTLTDVERARFVQRVARAFHTAGERGGTVRLRLSPPELGSLRLEIALRDGVMHARLEAEAPGTRSLLLDSLPALRERLAQQDVRLERFDVDLMGQSPGGLPRQAGEGRSGDGGQGGGPSPRAVARVAAADAPPRGIAAADGRLNVVI